MLALDELPPSVNFEVYRIKEKNLMLISDIFNTFDLSFYHEHLTLKRQIMMPFLLVTCLVLSFYGLEKQFLCLNCAVETKMAVMLEMVSTV